MDPSDNEQTELLRHIWNEMKALGTNLGGRIDNLAGRVDGVSERLDAVSERLDAVRLELKQEIKETNVRLGAVEGTLHELAAQQLMLGRYLKPGTERRVDELSERVMRIEEHLELGKR